MHRHIIYCGKREKVKKLRIILLLVTIKLREAKNTVGIYPNAQNI